MVILASLALDAALAGAGLAKGMGRAAVCRRAAMSAVINMTAYYISTGLAAEIGSFAFLEAVCAAGAKGFVIWAFFPGKEPKAALEPVYMLCVGMSLCVHGSPAAGLFCQLLLLFYLLFSEYKEERKDRAEDPLPAAGSRNLYLQTIEESYRKNRALMHDLNNHAVAMRALADSGEYEELVQYIDTFARKVGDNMFPVHSGNIVLDALLADKYHKAAAAGIPVLFEGVRYGAAVNDEDMCIVVGNLLDNAIEENQKCRDAKRRRISVRISSKEDSFIISVKNPVFHEIKIKNGLPMSEKPNGEHHGLGLKNVRRVCDKYKGRFVWEAAEGEFLAAAELEAARRE